MSSNIDVVLSAVDLALCRVLQYDLPGRKVFFPSGNHIAITLPTRAALIQGIYWSARLSRRLNFARSRSIRARRAAGT